MESRREGFALAATVLAMLVVGAIVTGGFYAASQETQVTRAVTGGDDALYIAETGLNATLGQATAATLSAMADNSTVTGSAIDVTVGSTVIGNYVASITRINNLYIISSEGTVTRGGMHAGGKRTVGAIARIRSADFDRQAAVMIYGDLKVGGTSEIDGNDYYPSSWSSEGCTLESASSAVVTNPSTNITRQGSGKIEGDITRETLDSGDFTVFGDITWNELIAMRDKYYPASTTVGPTPAVVNNTCNTTVLSNWGSGDPTNACFNYFPIIYAAGNLRISSSGEGQGILLVEGDLDISGGFNFYGVAIVMGEIKMTGTGGHINGTTIVYGGGNIDSSSSTVGNSLLQYSSCAIQRAVLGSSLSRAVPIFNRSWMDITSIQDA